MAKRSPVTPSRFKAKYDALNSNTRALIKFVFYTLLLISLGLVYHLNTSQEIESTQAFFEQRKDVQEYHQYKKDEEDAKKRAERNIFLQN